VEHARHGRPELLYPAPDSQVASPAHNTFFFQETYQTFGPTRFWHV